MGRKLKFIKAAAAVIALNSLVIAQDEAVVISAPVSWTTLRTDSLFVTIQADTSRLPKGTIDFKVKRNMNNRASAFFNKSVKVEDYNADIFLGIIRDKYLGGTDFLSIEWNVPGSELSGTVEPFGRAVIEETAKSTVSALKLKDGASITQISDALMGVKSQDIGASKFAAGWNKEGLYILFNPAANVSEMQFAFDAKCGRSAFLSWADRFIVYDANAESVRGVHYRRSVNKNAVQYDEMTWGEAEGLSLSKAENSKLIKAEWHELGLQPFEERNLGFAVFVNEKARKAVLPYPSAAKREIPGTWGELRLEK
ncbi:MAG: hypothetical protein FWE57_07120 [Chitinispirillia bacterium]|nr:hypothetical protein [Chitinispirillia bacterium]